MSLKLPQPAAADERPGVKYPLQGNVRFLLIHWPFIKLHLQGLSCLGPGYTEAGQQPRACHPEAREAVLGKDSRETAFQPHRHVVIRNLEHAVCSYPWKRSGVETSECENYLTSP